ncbi:MAG: PAS domain-containing protein, partial [Thermoleophilia bacterium]|nr:PAS domain-containing protein [Thermoleophilia bacterium]
DCDFPSGVVERSRGLFEVIGFRPEEIPATLSWWYDRIHPDDIRRMERDDEDDPVSGPRLAEYRVQHRDGRWLHVEDRSIIVHDADGRPARLIGCVVDVTERTRAEERFRAMADNIPQLAWMARPDGHIFWYNRRWYDYTGKTPEEMEGWGWQDVHDPAELPRVLAHWKAALARGVPWEDTFPLRRHDGVFRPHLSRARPLVDEEGRVVWWFGSNTDITELRELEEALREADRRKDEFLATLAHELRNPLAPIRNGLRIMRLAAGDPAAVDEAHAMVERQVGQMTHLIDDLMDVSRINRGKIALQRTRMPLDGAIRDAVETGRPLIEAARHHLIVDLPEAPIYVEGDGTRLAQVFANLLNNAAKYTERGGTIRLSARREGDEAVVAVEDDGVGIPPEMLPRVFDMFTQVNRSLEKAQGGLGIGLSIVRRLVEMHGGSVEAQSEGVGRGSRFVVRLPAVSAPTAGPDTANGDLAARPHARRILVVDDNRDNADSLALMLRIRGHETRAAHDGLEAIAVAEAFAPDVILMDIGMPRL